MREKPLEATAALSPAGAGVEPFGLWLGVLCGNIEPTKTIAAAASFRTRVPELMMLCTGPPLSVPGLRRFSVYSAAQQVFTENTRKERENQISFELKAAKKFKW